MIRVRYAGECKTCALPLDRGTQAWWHAEGKALVCVVCAGGEVVVDAGEAGGSAAREGATRRARREVRVRGRFPRIGGVLLALSEDPQHIKAWEKGADGEQRLGAALERLRDQGVHVLHDRRIPGTKANIDHIVVSPRGVFVVDAKAYSGEVRRRDVGGFFRTDNRLYVGRRDVTKLVTAMDRQVEAVERALDGIGFEPPIVPALCFIDSEWPWFPKPFLMGDVVITWPKALYRLVCSPGDLVSDDVNRIVSLLSTRLRGR